MRVSKEEKEKSRDRIVTAAAGLFRERGIEGASVGDIMAAAGMTHGGFYRHFADKEALIAAALTAAFEEFAQPLFDPDNDADRASQQFRDRYLSSEHRSHPGDGCPIAALGPDVARNGDAARSAVTLGVDRIVEGLSRSAGPGQSGREEALRHLATMVGAIVLARAVDEQTGLEIIEACRRPTKQAVEGTG